MTATITKWTEDLSVNVAEIDDQHKNLFKIIGDLSTAIQQGKNKEDLQKILEALTEYTVNHFTLEEDYFEQFDYPQKDSHKQAHDEFVLKVIRDFVTSTGLTVSSSTIFTASVFFEPLAVDRKFRGI